MDDGSAFFGVPLHCHGLKRVYSLHLGGGVGGVDRGWWGCIRGVRAPPRMVWVHQFWCLESCFPAWKRKYHRSTRSPLGGNRRRLFPALVFVKLVEKAHELPDKTPSLSVCSPCYRDAAVVRPLLSQGVERETLGDEDGPNSVGPSHWSLRTGGRLALRMKECSH